MKQIVEENKDFMFYIKLLPLKIHAAAHRKSKAIICEQSLRLLERAFDGKTVPEPTCETTEVDDTIELAERLGISGTPTLVLPDGGVVQGFRDAAKLLAEIREAGIAVEESERKALEGEDDAGAMDMETGPEAESASEPDAAEEEAGFGEGLEQGTEGGRPQEEEGPSGPFSTSPM